MRQDRSILAVLLAVVGLACPTPGDDGHATVNGVHQVPPAELHGWLHDDPSGARIIDVRILYDWRRGHLPGALAIPGASVVVPETGEPLDGGRALTGVVPDPDTRVVFYCSGAECDVSQTVAEAALRLGYTDVWRLDGGYPAWTDAGLEAAVTVADFCSVPFFPLATGDELADVRPRAEFDGGSIAGSVNVPRGTFLDATGLPVDEGTAFTSAVASGTGVDFVLASSADEALAVAGFAVGAGYRNLRLLEGGWADWTSTTCAAGAGP